MNKHVIEAQTQTLNGRPVREFPFRAHICCAAE